jgi:hypothetical protein
MHAMVRLVAKTSRYRHISFLDAPAGSEGREGEVQLPQQASHSELISYVGRDGNTHRMALHIFGAV